MHSNREMEFSNVGMSCLGLVLPGDTHFTLFFNLSDNLRERYYACSPGASPSSLLIAFSGAMQGKHASICLWREEAK